MAKLRTLQFYRGTAAQWTSGDPTLGAGEPGFETDTGKVKIGDGSTAWTSLLYATGGLNKYDAAAAPAVGDDDADGYSVGSYWIDTTNDTAYICLDASTGAAVWQEIGAGTTALISDTGTTITFTEDTLWNEATYLTSGALTLSLTSAVKGSYSVVYCDSYEPAISGETFYISSGTMNANSLNVLSFFYDGTQIMLNIGNINYLSAPTLSLTPGDTEMDVSWSAINNADTYLVQRDTTGAFSSPTTAYNSTGTSFTDTGLSNGTTYYYRATASGNGYLTSDYSATASDAPEVFDALTNLVASYNFNSDSTDYTTNNDGSDTGSPSYAGSGKVSNCVDLDGSTQHISIADSTDWSFTDGAGTDTSYSLSFWMNTDSLTGIRDFIIKRDLSGNNEWQINFSGSTLQWRNFNNGSTTAYIENTFDVNSAAGVTTGTWYHFVLTYDGSETAAGMIVYIDGTAYTSGQATTGTYTGMVNTTIDVFIGRRYGGATNYWDGRIDELHLWKGRVLDSGEVTALYGLENAGTSIL